MIHGKQGKFNTTLGLKNARLKLNSQQDEALTTGSCRLFSLLSLPKIQVLFQEWQNNKWFHTCFISVMVQKWVLWLIFLNWYKTKGCEKERREWRHYNFKFCFWNHKNSSPSSCLFWDIRLSVLLFPYSVSSNKYNLKWHSRAAQCLFYWAHKRLAPPGAEHV